MEVVIVLKITKIRAISFLLLFAVLASFPVYAANDKKVCDQGMHIDINDYGPGNVPDINIYAGESNKIKAEYWWDDEVATTTCPWCHLDMTIYDENGNEVCKGREETNWLGNAYFYTPSELPVGNYQIKISKDNNYYHTHAETWVNFIVHDPVKDNPNSATGNWNINADNVIQGQNISVSAKFVNTTRMADYRNQTPNKNSDLGDIDYVILDNENNIVKRGYGSLKLVNNQIVSDAVLNTANLNPGTYHLQSQIQGNSYIKNSISDQNFTIYSKDSSLSVSNESTLNVTQGDDAQVIAWINNDGLSKISPNNAPKANVNITVFDQNYNVITGDTFSATLVNGHYVAYMDWNTERFNPGTYKVHIAVNGNPCISDCDIWTNITIQPKN